METSRTTAGLFAKYGAERLCDTPIAERGFVGMGGGAAMTGTRPIIDFMFIDFINDAFGEIINQIAKMQYMSSGRLKMPMSAARMHWYRALGRHPSLGKLPLHLQSHSRLAGRDPIHAVRCQRALHSCVALQ